MGKVSSTCLVILERNRYSAPCELVGQIVSLPQRRHRQSRFCCVLVAYFALIVTV